MELRENRDSIKSSDLNNRLSKNANFSLNYRYFRSCRETELKMDGQPPRINCFNSCNSESLFITFNSSEKANNEKEHRI